LLFARFISSASAAAKRIEYSVLARVLGKRTGRNLLTRLVAGR
jgi:hypothetical protein